ncbi:MAG: AAA family ATPase [Myxococcota bacterium]
MVSAPGYTTTERLYEGDNSIVYRAIRQSDERSVILKALKAIQPSPKAIAQFKHEYLLTQELSRPGVITVHEHLQTENHWVIVCEDFGAESLRRLGLAGEIDVDRFLRLAIDITDIVANIHQAQVIHKDLNPSNIVLNRDTGVVKIIDFGISTRGLDRESVSFDHPTRLEGTPGYLSPEQTGRLNRVLDYRSDFYSLGCTFYELLTGHLPFDRDDLLELIHCHLAHLPVAPQRRVPAIPSLLSNIVLKLLAKNPDDRYQSCHGLKSDLTACLKYRAGEAPALVELGQDDVSTRFRLPDTLYGRAVEHDLLGAAFSAAAHGDTRLFLVTGHSGIGKSALIKQLYEPVTRSKGFFASGKAEQFERDRPYALVIEALEALLRHVLCEDEQRIAHWRTRLMQAVESDCALLIEIVPQVELLTGAMAPVRAESTGDRRFRLRRVLREFIRVFAQPEHPLVLFLDDLQWADGTSIEFIKALMTGESVPYLLVIGAYRDNEVDPHHPVRMMLDEVDTAELLQLAPLRPDDVAKFIAETFRTSSQRTAPLAALVAEKSGGNPFFVRQFLAALHTDGLLFFDHTAGMWSWDLPAINARDISDNVVDLLLGELHRLEPSTRRILSWAAFLGNQFTLPPLVQLSDQSAKDTMAELLPAIGGGFVVPLSGDYRLLEADVEQLEPRLELSFKFTHDRVQQAAYSLVPEHERASVHLEIGRQLRASGQASPLDIVEHLDAAEALLTDPLERLEVARLNLHAGLKTKSATAHDTAFRLFTAGLSFVRPPMLERGVEEDIVGADASAYDRDYSLTLRLTELATETAALCGDFESMERLADNVLRHARSAYDRVEVTLVKMKALTTQSQLREAIELALEILAPLGVLLPADPGPDDAARAALAVERALGDRTIESLASVPRATSTLPHGHAMRVLRAIYITTLMSHQALAPLVAAKMVELTLLHGRVDESVGGYCYHGVHLCERGDASSIEQGYRFAQTARAICHREELDEQLVDVDGNGYFHIYHLVEPVRDLIEIVNQCYRTAWRTGNNTMAAGGLANQAIAPFTAGFELDELSAKMRGLVEICEQRRYMAQATWVRAYWQCVLNLMGEHDADDPCVLRGEAYDEGVQLPIHQQDNDQIMIQLLHVLKTMLSARFGRYREAVASYSSYVDRRCPQSALFHPPALMLYCIARLALLGEEQPDNRASVLEDVEARIQQVKVWAQTGPTNYLHKAHLLEAEFARATGRHDDARVHYDRAIDLAREHRYLNDETLALERAASFFHEQGHMRLASYYMRDAHYAYQRWGAKAKLRELELRYPDLLVSGDAPRARSSLRGATSPSETRGTLVTGELPDLDLEAVLRATRAIRAEHDLAGLLRQVMTVCLTYAGARQGLLILARRGELVVKATGHLDETVRIELTSEALGDRSDLSHAVVRYVAKTEEPVVLDHASAEGDFKADAYIQRHGCKSVLCLPILYQRTLVGITYMENNQTSGAFGASHLELLSLLMTQAALSIDNAWLRSTDEEAEFRYTVGGSLAGDTPSYVQRSADRELVRRVDQREYCHVFNARQMGKSSLRVQAMSRLAARGIRCVAIDISAIGSTGVTSEQWYAGIARALSAGLGLRESFHLRTWWRERSHLSPPQRLAELIDEVVLGDGSEPIAIFVDEIDMMFSLEFSPDDFFGLVRSLYNKRADDPRYAQLSFVLLGVATPSRLIRDKSRTPFNIGHTISLTGFKPAEARVLARGLLDFDRPDLVLEAILRWTKGQPFLSQKLCLLARDAPSRPLPGKERAWVDSLVTRKVIDRWRNYDDPEHLGTIEARILESPRRQELLTLYAEVLEHDVVDSSATPLEFELLLTGLVVRDWGRLRIGNPIYANIFDAAWIKSAHAAPSRNH